MITAIYIAYQGDVNEFQSLSITSEHDDIDDAAISRKVDEAMRACLKGWWRNSKPHPHGFVTRMTEQGWEAWSVEYVNDSWTQGTTQRIGQGDDNREAPTAWPEFLGQIG